MAVIQISKIQVRRGLSQNLPQLASGELGWSIDDRRLYIGNGTLTEGSPEIGNTEILTIYSPIGIALGNIASIEANVSSLDSRVTALEANAATTTTTVVLADNTSSATNTSVILSSTTNIIEYRIVRGSVHTTGTITAAQESGTAVLNDEFTETASTGVTLSLFAFGSNAVIRYTTTNTGTSANLTYYNPRTFE